MNEHAGSPVVMNDTDTSDTDKPYIFGWTAHPDFEALKAAHADDPPIGLTAAVLIDRAWGKSPNLLLYFSTVEATEPVRRFTLSVWWNDGYHPKQHGPSFRMAATGATYMLAIRTTKNGTFTLDYAKEIALAAA